MSIEQLIDPSFVNDLPSLSLDEVRTRRGLCQDTEEILSLYRRMIQGRLDIVQAELARRAGGGKGADPASLVESLPEILVEHGGRHLGPGRLTSLGSQSSIAEEKLDELIVNLDKVIGGSRLTSLANEEETSVREIADQLDHLEREVSEQRHQLHLHIDKFQSEIVRRYKTGEASVEGLLGS